MISAAKFLSILSGTLHFGLAELSPEISFLTLQWEPLEKGEQKLEGNAK